MDEHDLWIDWVIVRTRFGHSIDSETAGTAYQEAIQTALRDLSVAIGTTNPPVLNVEDTEINLNSARSVSGSAANTVGDMLLELENNEDSGNAGKRARSSPDVLNLDAFLNLTCDTNEAEGK